MKKTLILGGLALLVAAGVVSFIVLRGDGETRDEHEGHDHGAQASHETKADTPEPVLHDDEHEGHDEGHGEEDKNREEGKDRVMLTPDQRKRINLEIATAGPGTIVTRATFPGETILNPDRMAHVVPRAAGIVREVIKTLGDRVKAGEILAWIESDELAEAKLAFYDKQTEIGCCKIKLSRAREIFENTGKLIALLEKEPGLEDIHKLAGLEMGEYRGRLVTAYAEYVVTKKTYERERALHGKKISSEREMAEAEAAFKKAQAGFVAAKDTARYQVTIAYTEAVGERQVAEFEVVAAEQRLRLKGGDDKLVRKLRALVPQTASLKPCLELNCTDCEEDKFPSVLDTLGKDKRFAWYAVRAPFAGFVINKHLTLGEKVNSDESVFSIADTSSVWVRFNVFQKDLPYIKPGQKARVSAGRDLASVEGTIVYVAPVIGKASRTAQARIVLDNTDGRWRPGLFVNVHVTMGDQQSSVAVPKTAVQMLGEARVVFVEEGGGFVPHPVKLGRSDAVQVEIISGLKPGQHYVVSGAFELKAKIVTSSLDSHAGHGH